jgi:hypothetical protein
MSPTQTWLGWDTVAVHTRFGCWAKRARLPALAREPRTAFARSPAAPMRRATRRRLTVHPWHRRSR